MAEEQTFAVQFRGRLSDDATGALEAGGMRWVSGHGGGTVPPGGDLPESDHQTVHVEASSESEAEAKVRDAVSPHGIFDAFSAQPFPQA